MGWEWELNFSLSLSLARSLRNNFNAEAAIFKWKSTKKSYFTLQRIRKSNWKTINCGIASFQAIVCGNTSGTTVISFACFFPFSCRFALQMLRLYWTPGQIHFKKPWWWRRKRVKAKRRKKNRRRYKIENQRTVSDWFHLKKLKSQHFIRCLYESIMSFMLLFVD